MSFTPEQRKEVEEKVRAFTADLGCKAFVIAVSFEDPRDTYYKGNGTDEDISGMIAELASHLDL